MKKSGSSYLYEYKRLFANPGSPRKPSRDQENTDVQKHILDVLLLGAFILGTLAFIASGVHQLFMKGSSESGSPFASLFFCMIVFGLYQVARTFSYRLSAYLLITLFILAGTYTVYRWSIDIPIGLLIFGLVISMSGILISSVFALVVTAIIAIILTTIGLLQTNEIIKPDVSWMLHPVEFGDAITFIALFVIISLISYLSTREINKSLQRAHKSEQALLKERSSLERKVVERTAQLEALQKARLIQLQRFADFGRISVGLVHDIANPLTVVSLRLKQLDSSKNSKLISEAMKSMKVLERYIDATRRQLQDKDEYEHESFEISDEISQVVDVISYKANMESVKIKSQIRPNVCIFGDPCKFSQIIANLVVNAIDAYKVIPLKQNRLVLISLKDGECGTIITVQDWGKGIEGNEIEKIFEPFYGVENSGKRGLGIGLSIVRRIVEEDFGGSVTVTSSRVDGTQFVVRLPAHKSETVSIQG
ncbi:MAG TPA: HAMP domain-containing sensor histidine kinase [Candidatus Saccharimonadia bacterium]